MKSLFGFLHTISIKTCFQIIAVKIIKIKLVCSLL